MSFFLWNKTTICFLIPLQRELLLINIVSSIANCLWNGRFEVQYKLKQNRAVGGRRRGEEEQTRVGFLDLLKLLLGFPHDLSISRSQALIRMPPLLVIWERDKNTFVNGKGFNRSTTYKCWVTAFIVRKREPQTMTADHEKGPRII